MTKRALWHLFQQAVRKDLWPFARHTPSFSLQIIPVFGLWEEAVYLKKPFKGPGRSVNNDHEGNAAPNLETITPGCAYLASSKLNTLPGHWNLISKVWVQAHEASCHGFSVWCAIGIPSRGPGCMSSSESGRIKPEQHEVHDLANIISTAPGSPRGELLMAALAATSVLVSRCHVGEKFDPKVSDNHIPSFFPPRRVWDSGSWHPGTSDLSWLWNGHQSQLLHSMSGSRPKWFAM